MKTSNYGGFSLIEMSIVDFVEQADDRELLEVIKTSEGSFLYRAKTNQMYMVSDKGPEMKEEEKLLPPGDFFRLVQNFMMTAYMPQLSFTGHESTLATNYTMGMSLQELAARFGMTKDHVVQKLLSIQNRVSKA